MAIVRSLNKNYDGVSIGVQFTNGQGETDDGKKLDWFIEHGFEVEGSAEQTSQYDSQNTVISQSDQPNDAEFANEVAVADTYDSQLSSQTNEITHASHEKTNKAKKH
jgi:hypothetical protein